MRKLFDVIPPNLFSILSPYNSSFIKNKYVYADALIVLYEAFNRELKLKRVSLVEQIKDKLANELMEYDIDEDYEEENNLTGRAKWIVKKLYKTGWIEFEREQNFEEYVILLPVSRKLLKTFHELINSPQESSFSYVYDTYSALKQANSEEYDKERYVYNALYSAVKHTEELIELLSNVYHSINNYCRKQAALTLANDIISAHYDEFNSVIIENYIKPLKLKESIPKYKSEIISIITNWLNDEELINKVAECVLADKRFKTIDDCVHDVVAKLYFVKESYEDFEKNYISQIDDKVRKYTKTTTQKLAAITNSDSNLSGNLAYLLNYISKRPDDEYANYLINQSFKCIKKEIG